MSPAPKKAAVKKAAPKAKPTETVAEKPAEPVKATSKRIVKQTDRAWWCPVCDHSNSLLTPTCGGCGAHRDGDAVKAA